MRLSVVVPTFDHERWVARCLASIDAQEHDDLEVIVVDDGSRDRSAEMAEAYRWRGDRAVRVVRAAHAGAHAALNRGLDLATGEWIAVCNSDDEFVPGRIPTLLRRAHDAASRFVFSAVQFVDGAGSDVTRRARWASTLRARQDDIRNAPSVGFALLRSNVAISSGNFFFHRSLIDDIGYFRPYRHVHDWDFLLRALLFTEPAYVAEPLYRYRLHDTNAFRALEREDVAAAECPDLLRRFMQASCTGRYPNPLAPSPAHWPVYFDVFVGDHGYRPYLTGWQAVDGVAHRPAGTRGAERARREPRDRFAHVGSDEWRRLLLRSIDEPVIDGVEFPGFPSGSAGPQHADALTQACAFFEIVHTACHRLGRPVGPDTRLLHLGVEWGCTGRTFLRDVPGANLLGVDWDADALDLCRRLLPLGRYGRCGRESAPDVPDASVDLAVAFAPFARLAPAAHLRWLAELHRVLAPRGVLALTTLSRAFLDQCVRCAASPATDAERLLGARVRLTWPDWTTRLAAWPASEYLHLPADGRDGEGGTELDGWAMAPRGWTEEHWSAGFDIAELVEDPRVPSRVCAVLQKRAGG